VEFPGSAIPALQIRHLFLDSNKEHFCKDLIFVQAS
jgi:hypothetical protein